MSSEGNGRGEASEAKRADGLLTTGDMARITGNTLRTVRFYEEAGILRPDRRSAGGHRLFSQRELERLQFISDMRAASLSLDEIRGLLELKERAQSGREAAEGALGALDRQLKVIEEKMAVFARLKAELEQARVLLDHCRDCTNERPFPSGCHDCEVMSGPGVPQSMRVLWSLSSEADHSTTSD
ncbi:MAG: MerR family transcriptional regulator [Polyangiaceae bacterium]